MDNILFESFSRVNATFFNNEYALIVPRFSSFFAKYEKEMETKAGVGSLVSSYYNCMKLFKFMINHESYHKLRSRYDIVGSKEILFDQFANEYFNQNLLGNFIVLKKEQLDDPENFSIEKYNEFVKKMSAGEGAKDYIKSAFSNALEFLEKWEADLGVNLLAYYRQKLGNERSFLYKTLSAKEVLSYLLTINRHCRELEWSISLTSHNTLSVLSDLTGIPKEKLLAELSQEIFFNNLLGKDESVNYYSLQEFLMGNFNHVFLDAALSENPKKYIIESLLEKVPQTEMDGSTFHYLKTDIEAIQRGIETQSGFKLLLHGIAGAGKTEFSKVLAKTAQKDMYRIKMSDNTDKTLGYKINLLLNIANVFQHEDFVLLLDECEEFFENDNKYKEQINYVLEKLNIPCVFIANEIKNFHEAYLRRFNYHISLDVCDYDQKVKIINHYASEVLPPDVIKYIATQSVTNADITENIKFYLATRNFEYLRQKVENKQITTGMIKLNQVEKSMYSFIYPENNNFVFDEIVGYAEEKEMLLGVKHYLDNKDKYNRLKVSVPRGSILYGFPGTGKTSMIKALAKKCQLPVISVTTGMMSNDATGALNIKKVFNLAKKNAPCIILLDEFEKMAINRKLEIENGSSQSLMNQLLFEMDELQQQGDDVFVYATCNTVSYIDPAISRSGRLEQMIEIGLPNAKTREQIIKNLLTPEFAIKGIKQIVQNTIGFSYVDLKSTINNYKIALLKNNSKYTRSHLLMKEIHDFMLGKTSSKKLLKEEKKTVAYHESGHAFLAYLFDKNVGNVSIIPKSGYIGVTLMLGEEMKQLRSKDDVEKEVMVLMGGRASEKIFLGKETTGSSDDFSRATALVMNNLNILSGHKLGLLYAKQDEYNDKYSETYKVKVEESVNEVMENLYQKTQSILTESKEEIESMVNVLLKKEEIIQNEVEGILNNAMLAKNVTKMSKLHCL